MSETSSRPYPPGLEAWTRALCAELGADPESVPIQPILDLARDAAHNVTRPAAPVSAFIVGLLADGDPAEAARIARVASRFALSWPDREGGTVPPQAASARREDIQPS
jgi:Domain of unknown function (DUF6457)